ncbi:MAG: GNAT family N-acetyltransferase [Acholeplasmataceae bacterium]|nr:GNAT family N-acetyltransferase [Acholeplasmataceae bacterium]
MELFTKRMILKPVSLEDKDEIFTYFNAAVTTFMYPKPADDISEIITFIKSSIIKYKNKQEIIFVGRLKETNEFIGVFGLHQIDTKTPELGVWTKIEAHGNKYGLEGITELVAYAYEHLDYKYLIYPVDRRNLASRNIPETLGGIIRKAYKEINESGNELDTVEYHIFKEEPLDLKYPVLLFQGDSITDSNRDRSKYYDLGNGYVSKLLGRLNHVVIINRGESGNRTSDLLERWEEDTIQIKPDFLSILVGINEVWHHYAFGKDLIFEEFRSNYTKLLEAVKTKLLKTKILLIEPFCFQIGEYDLRWEKDLDEVRRIVKELASKYADYFIPMQDIFDEYKKRYKMEEILYDGVHPTELGHEIIGNAINECISKELFI